MKRSVDAMGKEGVTSAVVFRVGRIVEEGTHGELLAGDGLYAELCPLQELR